MRMGWPGAPLAASWAAWARSRWAVRSAMAASSSVWVGCGCWYGVGEGE